MPRSKVFFLALATLSATTATLFAQNAYVAGSGNPIYSQSQAAPIERSGPAANYGPPPPAQPQGSAIATSQPAPGVTVRTDQPNALHIVTSDATRTELRLDHGRANVTVHDPAADSLVLVDLPGGQSQLLKNGFYTFNADTNTVRVLVGEVYAFPAANPNENPRKVKEDQQLVFAGADIRSHDVDPYTGHGDLLPGAVSHNGYAHGEPGYAVYPRYAYGPYGDGFYGYPYYPYYAYGYPYWGWGYPVGFGWGWGGGFYRGGYGGGFHGGFRR
jgi:hypothetical protein